MSAPVSPAVQPATLRRVLLNALSLVGAYVLPRACTAAAVVVAARVLGPDQFGMYGTAAAFAVILSIVATLGMMPLLVREMARAPEGAPSLLRAAHTVKLGAGACMLLALVAVAHWVLAYPPAVVGAAALLGLAYAIGAFVENLGAWFQAVERMHVWMQATAVFGLVTGVAGAWLVWSTGSVVWFCAAPVLGQVTALLWLVGKVPRALRRPGPVPLAQVRRLSRAVAPFAAAFVALTIFYKVDVLLLNRWQGAGEVGLYVAAYKFVDVVHALVLAGVAAVFPRLARAAPGVEGPLRGARDGGASTRRWAATRVSELLLLVAVPGAGLLWMLRADLVGLLYGAGFGPAAAVLGLLAPALPALALNLLAGYVLAATGHMRAVALAYLAGAAWKVGLNAVLVPTMGAPGAALAMLVSELALAAVLITVVHRVAGAAPDGRTLVAAGMAGGIWVLVTLLPGALSTGPTAAVFYGALVAFVYGRRRVVGGREWQLLREALRP